MKKLLILLLLAIAPNTQAKTYLYVFFHDDNSTGERFRTELPNMQTCLESIKHAKMPTPDKPSGDYEVMGAMWCGGDLERAWNSTWWKDPSKDSNE